MNATDDVTPVTFPLPADLPDPWLVPEFLRLNERSRAFVKAYLTEAKGNATEATILSGFTGKHPRKNGSDLMKKQAVREAITACRPVLNALERWEARNQPVPQIEAVGRKLKPRWKRRDMLRWCESIAEGIDPDYQSKEDLPQPVIPWEIRTKAARMLKELRGWDPVREKHHVHRGRIEHAPAARTRPLEDYARALPDAELYAQLEAAKARNTVKYQALRPALPAGEQTQAPKETVTDAETETNT